jgi:membrane fusion protein, copper/silver efflux system
MTLAVTLVMLASCGGGSSRQTSTADSGMRRMPMTDSEMEVVAAVKAVWTCPMHPEVMKDKPGICPICGMDLVTKEIAAPKGKGLNLEDLLQPANGFVVSAVATTLMRRDTVRPELKVLGIVAYDTRLQNTIAARVSGRIERLYVRFRYQHVHRGQRLMDIYSPELATGEQEYLYLLKNDPGNAAMIEAARQRLLLLGVNGAQLEQIVRTEQASPTLGVFSPYTGHIHEAGNPMPGGSLSVAAEAGMTAELPVKEGMYVEKGQSVFQVFNMDRGWVLLSLYPGQEALVRKGDPVEIVPETAPEKAFAGRVDLVEPAYRQGNRSLTARVYFDNSRRGIPIGSAVKATIRPAGVAGNWLPKEAVLSLGTDKVVFLRQDGGFRAHSVVAGLQSGDRMQILTGLSDRDSVAANAQFLMDSEDFVKVKN